MRRKVVDQQEATRRQKLRQMSQLPPVSKTSPGTATNATRLKAGLQDKRFTQTLDPTQAAKQQADTQGMTVGRLLGDT